MINRLGDVSAIAAGYATVDAHGSIFAPLTAMVGQAANVQAETSAEIIKMIVGLLIGLLSKIIYGYIDKRFTNKKTQTQTEGDEKEGI